MSKRPVVRLLFLLALAILAACDFGDLTLRVLFRETAGLAAGDRILDETGYVGDVEGISGNSGGRSLVELDIDRDHRRKMTVHSIFYIDDDPERPGRKAIFTEQTEPGGAELEDGSVIAGLESPPA